MSPMQEAVGGFARRLSWTFKSDRASSTSNLLESAAETRKAEDRITKLKASLALPDRALRLDDFTLSATVGTGTFGRVRVATLTGDERQTPVALKIMKKQLVIRLKQVEHVRNERAIMSSVQHPFIVNLLATFQDAKRLFVVLEYVNGGELFSHLREEGYLPSDHCAFYGAEIICAFEYLHGRHIAYRDLKPENLLLDHEGHMKITDFGFAKVVEDRTWTLCGTPEYLAPEIIQSKGHGCGVDWWALGVLLYEIMAGYPPFYDENPFGIYQKVLAGKLDFPRLMDAKAKDLIRKLCTADWTKRLGCLRNGAEDVKKHKWYSSMKWDLVLQRRVPPPFDPFPAATDPADTSRFDPYPESTEASAPEVSDEHGNFEGF